MGGGNAKPAHPMDEYFDINRYRRMKPNFTDPQIVSIFDLFKSMDPDQYGMVQVDRIQNTFRKSSDKDQLRE